MAVAEAKDRPAPAPAPGTVWVDRVVLVLALAFIVWALYMMWAHPRVVPPLPGHSTGSKTTQGAWQELWFRCVKVVDIGYIVALYVLAAVGIGVVLALMLPAFDAEEADRHPMSVVIAEVVAHLWIVSVCVYGMRQVMEIWPSPLHGVGRLNHYRLKELGQPALFNTILIQTQLPLLARLAYLIRRAEGRPAGK